MEYLWVNKNADSKALSSSAHREASDIRSHVRKQVHISKSASVSSKFGFLPFLPKQGAESGQKLAASAPGSAPIDHSSTTTVPAIVPVPVKKMKAQYRKHKQHRTRIKIEDNPSLGGEHILSSDRLDPFDSFAVKGLPLYIYRLLELSARLKWSSLAPELTLQSRDSIKKEWMMATMESSSLLHAQTASAISVLQIMRSSSTKAEQSLRLRHQTESFARLHHEIKALNGQRPSESTLLAVMTLSVHGELLQMKYAPKGYPDSPLHKQQNVQLYGMMEMIPEHIEATYLILETLGGIDKVKMFGLQATIEFYDLFVATRFDIAPRLIWRHPIEPLISDVDYLPDTTAKQLSLKMGIAFDGYLELDIRCTEAIRLCKELLISLDQYQRRSTASPSTPALVRARNAVHHRLLSLRPHRGPLQTIADQASELCRLTLLLLSCTTFFPIPLVTGVSYRLVSQLRQVIDRATASMWNFRHHLLTWALVLGGIGAMGTAHRDWYVSTFEARSLCSFGSLVDLKGVLEAHIWWDLMFHEASERFWIEVQHRTIP